MQKNSSLRVTNLKTEFESRNLANQIKDFIQPINGDEIIWEIQWNSKNILNELDKNKDYTYIPIEPRLLSGTAKIKTYNFHRYLLITRIDEKNSYSIAYAYDEKKTSHEPGNTKFNGKLHIKSLEDQSSVTYSYENGIYNKKKTSQGKLMIGGKQMTTDDCIITYNCSWGTVCSGGIVYITSTTGSNCTPPIMFDPCGNSSDQVYWSFNGSYEIGRFCFPNNPPVDPPIPPGGEDPQNPNPNPNNDLAEKEPSEFHFAVADPADLKKQFKCFESILDIVASYKMEISVDLPVNNDPSKLVTLSTMPPSPGHVFITLTKFGGSDYLGNQVQISKSFGFYPSPEILSLSVQSVGSKIVDDGGREKNASKANTLSKEEFEYVMEQAMYLAGHRAYDINDYNCTDYALDVWNSILDDTNKLSAPDWIGPTTGLNYGRTPNGLYNNLAQKKAYGDFSISLSSGDKAPSKTSSSE